MPIGFEFSGSAAKLGDCDLQTRQPGMFSTTKRRHKFTIPALSLLKALGNDWKNVKITQRRELFRSLLEARLWRAPKADIGLVGLFRFDVNFRLRQSADLAARPSYYN